MRAFVWLLLPLAAWAQAGSSPADLATLTGQVFNAIGGIPLRKANLTLSRVTPPNTTGRSSYSAATDADGRYSIAGIEPGRYSLEANRTGFLAQRYNARTPSAPGTPIEFARGENKTGVDFHLTPQSVISGKVVDDDGDPIVRVQIEILRVTYRDGRKQLTTQGGVALTDDRGEFRVFGLRPGKVYLLATPPPKLPGGPAPPDGEQYVPVYYPGVEDPSAASPIELNPGEQAEGVTIRISTVRTVKVTIHVTDSSGSPPPQRIETNVLGPDGVPARTVTPMGGTRVQVHLFPHNAMGVGVSIPLVAPVPQDGNFTFQAVPAGSYDLIALSLGSGHFARVPVEVGQSNLDSVNITIPPAVTVSGHIRYDGDAPTPLPRLQVKLAPREILPMGAPGAGPTAAVDPQGNFHFDEVNPDQYRVTLNVPKTLYLKSLRAGNSDVLASGLDLSTGGAELDILLGTNPPQVSGSVVNAETGQPAPGATVVLIPRDKEKQGKPAFYQTASSDPYGNFTFSGVLPGDYLAYAWEDVETYQWYDPEWLKAYGGKGEPVSAQEGSPVSLKLTLIPAR